MVSDRFEILRRARLRATPRSRVGRKFQPAIDGIMRLEPRTLMHGGSVVAHVSRAQRFATPPVVPDDPVPLLQQALAFSYSTAPGAIDPINMQDGELLVPSGLVPGHTYPMVVATEWDGSPTTPGTP